MDVTAETRALANGGGEFGGWLGRWQQTADGKREFIPVVFLSNTSPPPRTPEQNEAMQAAIQSLCRSLNMPADEDNEGTIDLRKDGKMPEPNKTIELSPLAQKLREQHTSIRCADNEYQIRLVVVSQQFGLDYRTDTREDAEWYRDLLARSLEMLVVGWKEATRDKI